MLKGKKNPGCSVFVDPGAYTSFGESLLCCQHPPRAQVTSQGQVVPSIDPKEPKEETVNKPSL